MASALYGHHHRNERRRLLTAALGQPCPGPASGPRSPRCTHTLAAGHVDLDHGNQQPGEPHRIICTHCNRYHGAHKGAARRWSINQHQPHSRVW